MNEKAEKLVLNTSELAETLGICRPRAYELMRRSDFPAIQLSERRRVVPRAALEEWLRQQASRHESI